MKLSTILFIASQIAIALSQKTGGPQDSVGPDDGRGSIPATELPPVNRLTQRACWNGAPYGCSKGYCFRTCGSSGEWCWLAASGGNGPWVSCTADSQCAPGATQGTSCARGNCKDCGCSC